MNIRANHRHALGASLIAVALAFSAGCASTGPGYSTGNNGYNNGYSSNSNANCYDCGVVTRIETGVGSRAPNATGAVVGGLVGAVAGRKIADSNTDSQGRKNTATVAGAVAGGLIGNAIQNRAGTGYNVYVRLDNGQQVVAMQDDIGGIREGSRVRVSNGRAYQQ